MPDIIHKCSRAVYRGFKTRFVSVAKNPFKSQRRGIVLLLVVVLTSTLLVISLGIFSIVFGELLISGQIVDSFIAFYAADEGIERILYIDRVAGAICAAGGTPCYTENITVASGACFDATVSRTIGPPDSTTITINGEYRCGAAETRVVRRAFDLGY